MKIWDLIIIGAGPAGLMAGVKASSKNKSILILDGQAGPGKKLLLSGSGQCNFTHSGERKDFLIHFNKPAQRFLKSALYFFDNHKTIEFFYNHNVPSWTREDGKVFPKSMKAQDILDALLEKCSNNKVLLHYSTKIKKIEKGPDVFHVLSNTGGFRCKKLILATGGKSYPKTGSDGSGFELARLLGHTVSDISPALTPVNIKAYPFSHLSGISFPLSRVQLYRNDKKVSENTGGLLLTHQGLSGPAILDFSRSIQKGDELKLAFISVENEEEWKKQFLSAIKKAGKKQWKNFLQSYLGIPERLLDTLLELEKQEPKKPCNEVSKKQIFKLLENLYYFRVMVKEKLGYHQAMVTSGGVSLSEVNPKTMESKKVSGLFFAGEVLDIDGDTGGYNIQAAFSTGALAGTKSLES